MAHKKIVTRFAPSPTGFLHIGSVRTALFAWLFARQQGNDGQFILRIEDTDKAREVTGAVDHIITSMKWLGLDWEFGPDKPSPIFGSCLQSERLDVYRQYARQLLEKGFAYPDPYTNDEVEAFRSQAQAEKRPFLFRNHRPDTFADWDGSQPLRFKVPDIKRYTWHDEVRGELTAGEEMVDDIILIKADGFPTYNFAHIVDDHEMGVTHVMRGEEFISSTPKFLSIIDALGFERPIFATLPPIMGPDGKKKLSKRDGAKDLLDYKNDGYLPEAMVNFLALIGWNPGTDQEILSREDLLEQFSLKKIQRSGGAFNLEKLEWMNGEYLAKLPAEEKVVYVCNALPELDKERLTKLTPTILERHNTKVEIREAYETGEYDWVQKQPEYDTQLLQWKNDESVKDAKPRLEELQTLLSAADFSSPEAIKAIVWPYAEAKGKGEVLWPLRVALSGKAQSPDPFTLAYVLGQSDTIARISNACGKI
jgi:glutamyl-tRNA synthetase